ncbi:hypothetical protein D3C71_1891170 [compost metagenome]
MPCFVGIHTVTGQKHIEGTPGRNDARQTLGTTATGNQTQTGFRQGKDRIRRGEADVASQRQLQPAPHAVAVNSCDDWLGHRIQRLDPARAFHALTHLQ